MDTDLFNKIATTLKDQFPNTTDEFLMQKACERYEAEMQIRSKLSEKLSGKVEQLSEEYRDILKGK
jgi:hypothetical protein